MKTSYITVKTQFAGIHQWSKCPHEEVSFLRFPHRHMFHVYVDIQVTHKDRDLEFFMVQHEINEIIKDRFDMDTENGIYDLEDKSCETVADMIIDGLKIYHPKVTWIRASVSEDKENGGSVVWEMDKAL